MNRISRFVALSLIVLLAGCSARKAGDDTVLPVLRKKTVVHKAAKKPVEADDTSQIATLHPRQIKKRTNSKIRPDSGTVSGNSVVIRAEKHKTVREFVQIKGKSYRVPLPWRGAKIVEPSPEPSRLIQIPLQFTWEQSQIFVEKDSCRAFVFMAEQALLEGVHLMVHSGYRSVWYQRRIFEKLMAKGRTWDDLVRYVAPPGYSEHATGTVVDLYPSDWRFAETEAYGWLQKNAARFGFKQTYPEVSSRGFPWEAWHWRFMGLAESAKAAVSGNNGAQKKQRGRSVE